MFTRQEYVEDYKKIYSDLNDFGFKVKGEFKITAQFGYVYTYSICEK